MRAIRSRRAWASAMTPVSNSNLWNRPISSTHTDHRVQRAEAARWNRASATQRAVDAAEVELARGMDARTSSSPGWLRLPGRPRTVVAAGGGGGCCNFLTALSGLLASGSAQAAAEQTGDAADAAQQTATATQG